MLARFGKCACQFEGRGVQDVCPCQEQVRERLTRSRPINARLCGGPGCNAYGAYSTSSLEWRKTCHRSHQWLADRDHISALKKSLKSLPIFFVRQRVEI